MAYSMPAFRSLARAVGNQLARACLGSTRADAYRRSLMRICAPEEFEQRTGTAWLAFWVSLACQAV